jgi:hypothetical protein
MRLPLDHLVSQRFQAQVMRSVNGIGLLNLLSEQGPISRAALAKVSHLSKPTVSSQIEALIQQGLVVELGQAKAGTRGGKKPTLLRFNPDAGRMFAAEIHPEQIRAVVTDIEGTILDRTAHPLNGDRSAGKVIGVLQRELERLINGHTGRGIQKLISIAAPGRVDAIRGVVLEAGNLFNWHRPPSSRSTTHSSVSTTSPASRSLSAAISAAPPDVTTSSTMTTRCPGSALPSIALSVP